VNVDVDIWLRGQDFATTRAIRGIEREPGEWTDDDVRAVLQGMLAEMQRAKNPEQTETYVALRGLSWIVNPFEGGGVVIAIEISLGAAVSGPFAIEQHILEQMIQRVLLPIAPSSTLVH
jgi:hypothetical protein